MLLLFKCSKTDQLCWSQLFSPLCQAIEIIRGCAGLQLVGCDLVEVSPAYDTTGNTALTAGPTTTITEILVRFPQIRFVTLSQFQPTWFSRCYVPSSHKSINE